MSLWKVAWIARGWKRDHPIFALDTCSSVPGLPKLVQNWKPIPCQPRRAQGCILRWSRSSRQSGRGCRSREQCPVEDGACYLTLFYALLRCMPVNFKSHGKWNNETVIEKLTRVRMFSASPFSLLLGIAKQPPNIRIRRKGEHVLKLAARILCVILLLSDCSRLILDVEDYLSVIIEIIKGLWQPQRVSCSIESSM